MVEPKENALVVGLEVGNSKVVSVIAEIQDNQLYVRGLSVLVSRGMNKGIVTNIDAVIDVINSSIKSLEKKGNWEIHSVTTSIAGQHIEGDNSHGMVPLLKREVTLADKWDVIEKAGIVPIPDDRMVLHVLPQDYVIDNQGGIENPLGMTGVRLETNAYVVTCAKNTVHNLNKCIEKCNIKVDQYVYQGLSSSIAVATKDEKKLGVCVVDIGSGTTDLVVYVDGAIVYSFSFPIAGDVVTNDIAYGERLTTDLAEHIKINDGCCHPDPSLADKYIIAPAFSNQKRQVSKYQVAKIMEARYSEILELIRLQLKQERLTYQLGAGIILTGGGSLAKEILPLAEEILDMPARIGFPVGFYGEEQLLNNPMFANIVGLLHVQNDPSFQPIIKEEVDVEAKGVIGRLVKTFKQYF